jgi:hypothetical protein
MGRMTGRIVACVVVNPHSPHFDDEARQALLQGLNGLDGATNKIKQHSFQNTNHKRNSTHFKT